MGGKCCSGRVKVTKRLGREIEEERYGQASDKFRRAVRKLIRLHISASALSTQPFSAAKCVGIVAAFEAEDQEFEALMARRDVRKKTVTTTAVHHNHHNHHRPSFSGLQEAEGAALAAPRQRAATESKELAKVAAPPPPEHTADQVAPAPLAPRPSRAKIEPVVEAGPPAAAVKEVAPPENPVAQEASVGGTSGAEPQAPPVPAAPGEAGESF
eukprot:TRINITY_DN75310_c0_g1_i1.p1 TRINITY_DN75310_c0_g1~~TRINITY_DN75310_c0_g1_i1.p1  ORF type:complete len:213 (+),score=61.07 TRINITY_DN75310_c0_g1_i1:107-745(+)